MIDNLNPTSQFHPYQRPDAIPRSDRSSQGGLGGILSSNLGKVRAAAQRNPGKVLGGLAALVIGAGLMRRRFRGAVNTGSARSLR